MEEWLQPPTKRIVREGEVSRGATRGERRERARARGERGEREARAAQRRSVAAAQRRSGAAAQRRSGTAAQRRSGAQALMTPPFESFSPLYITNRVRLVDLRNPSEQARASLVHIANVCCLLSAVCCLRWLFERTDGRTTADDHARASRLAPADPDRGGTPPCLPRAVVDVFFDHSEWPLAGKGGGGAPCEVPDLRLISQVSG